MYVCVMSLKTHIVRTAFHLSGSFAGVGLLFAILFDVIKKNSMIQIFFKKFDCRSETNAIFSTM
jgi:hypothetical protein